jgi:CubicO group peptidase (beta-lactamase class C family)/pimeloyl-ACP methyl ester carboxylesterase
MSCFIRRCSFCCLLLFVACMISPAGAKAENPNSNSISKTFPGVKSVWNGFDRYDFTCDGRKCIVVTPKKAAEGRPWIWRARFFGHEPQTDLALLAHGFHLAYIDCVELYGNAESVAHWNAFYDLLTTQHGLAKRVALEGMSRGALYVFNWAARNSEKVACIYADAPCCDIHSFLHRKDNKHLNDFLVNWLKAFGITEQQAAASFHDQPIDLLEPLARAGVPLLHVVGDADEEVPVAEHTAIVESRYKKLGGQITVIHKPGVGHHPHSLKDPTPIVEFILRNTPTANQTVGAKTPADVAARMKKFVDDGEVSGVVAVIGRRDKILCNEAVGLRDIDARRPMTQNTLFRIASMTKPITSVGLMILVDEGRVSIDDNVEKYLPEFRGQMVVASRTKDTVTLKKPQRPIKIRDLLTHTSGLASTGEMPGLADLAEKRDRTLAEGVLAVSQRPLNFEPGSQWAYSNFGIDTLGRIVEVVAEQPYENFLKTRIFEPLGMTDTAFYPNWEQLNRTATAYDFKNGKLVALTAHHIAPGENVRYPFPAGGLYSTGSDLAKFYQMMLGRGSYQGRRILSEKAVAAMTSLQTGDLKAGFVPGMGFGLGVGYVREPVGVTRMLSVGSFGHGGYYATQAWVDPKQDFFIVLMIQRLGLQPNGDASKLREALQELAVEMVQNLK